MVPLGMKADDFSKDLKMHQRIKDARSFTENPDDNSLEMDPDTSRQFKSGGLNSSIVSGTKFLTNSKQFAWGYEES